MARVGENTRVEKTIMAQDDIHRILWRMTHQIIERHKGAAGLFFVGIPTRGLPLAHRLTLRIRELDGEEVPVASLDIGPTGTTFPGFTIESRYLLTPTPYPWR